MNTIRTVPDQLQRSPIASDIESLQEENELLFSQLHVVQEELEQLRQGASARHFSTDLRVVFEDGRYPDVAAENLRYRTLLEVRQEVHRLESQYTIAGRLTEILLQGTTSLSALLALPARLLKIWRKERKQVPPALLGGSSFNRVLAAYADGGTAAVDELLARVPMSATTQANALTALARSLMHTEPSKSAEFARRAYSLEPLPFRLKWLLFRLHEAGMLIEAEAMLEALPPNTAFSDSEARQANRLRSEAKQARLLEALQTNGYPERRGKVEQQIGRLEQAHREQTELATNRAEAIKKFEATQSQLQKDHADLLEQLAEKDALVIERGREVEALEAEVSKVCRENSALLAQHAAQVEIAAKHGSAIEALEKAQSRLEQEKSELLLQRAQGSELVSERDQTIEALKAAQRQLADEKSAALEKNAEHIELAAERGRVISVLTETQAQLEREKAELFARHVEQANLAEERGQAIELLKVAEAKQEEEKSLLSMRHMQQVKLAEENEAQIKELQEQIQSRLTMESALSARQYGMHEELVKAEAQLEFIKDIVLRGARL